MASNPFNALLFDPAQVGQGIMGAFQMGREQRSQMETQRALGNYAKNMTPENAAAVSQWDPRTGIQLQKYEQERQAAEAKAAKEAKEQQITAAALQGDPQARQALAYYNSELYLKLGTQQKQTLDQLYGAIGQQAQSILRLPKEQQEGALQQALAGLQAQGIDTSQFKLTGNPEIDLRTALAISGQLDDFEKSMQPSYMAIPAGGTLVNTRDPQAISQFGQPQAAPAQSHPNFTQAISAQQFAQAFANIPPAAAADAAAKAGAVVKVSSPDEARQLPSGTWILLPDNTYGRVP